MKALNLDIILGKFLKRTPPQKKKTDWLSKIRNSEEVPKNNFDLASKKSPKKFSWVCRFFRSHKALLRHILYLYSINSK